MAIKNPTLKKVTFIDPIVGGQGYMFLFRESGEAVPFVTEYLRERKSSGLSDNTVKAEANALFNFFNYLTEAALLVESIENSGLHSPLYSAIMGYPKFLASGSQSDAFLPEQVGKKLGFKGVNRATQALYLSNVTQFIRASAISQQNLQGLSDLDLIEMDQKQEIIGQEILKRKKLSRDQKSALIKTSMLASVISGGPKYVSSAFFKPFGRSEDAQAKVTKAFPIDRIISMISSASCARDQALWALLAGTGIRISEALNLLTYDVSPRSDLSKVISIHPPSTRANRYPLKNGRANIPPFKGRGTAETWFLEPFLTIFKRALSNYLEHERPLTDHDVLFVNLSNNGFGNPMYFASNTGSINKAFKRAAEQAGVAGFTIHSLRHFYGVFTLNYVEIAGCHGLPLDVVSKIMGHKSIESTKGYAIRDSLIVSEKLRIFNSQIKSENITIDSSRHNALIAITGDSE